MIKDAIPAYARRSGGHPAKKSFQAIRVAVNNELEVLQESLEEAIKLLKPGGRISVITFQSHEDKIVKMLDIQLIFDQYGFKIVKLMMKLLLLVIVVVVVGLLVI